MVLPRINSCIALSWYNGVRRKLTQLRPGKTLKVYTKQIFGGKKCTQKSVIHDIFLRNYNVLNSIFTTLTSSKTFWTVEGRVMQVLEDSRMF